MNKKFISAIMAGALAISSLGISAFAADPAFTPSTDKGAAYAGKAQSYKIAATLATPELKVTLPTAITAVINPYGIKATVGKDAAGTNGVVSPVYAIKNKSMDMAITVSATASATVTDKISLITDKTKVPTLDSATQLYKAFASTDETKEVFAELCASPDETTAPARVGSNGIIFVAEADAEAAKVMDITGASSSNADGDVGYIQIQGVVSNMSSDKAVNHTWTSADKVNLVLVLDITPSKATTTAVAT